MKLILSCIVALIVILIGISSQAQVPPLMLYDNFESKYLNPDLWYGVGTITGGSVLESVRQIKPDPSNIKKKVLYFLYRGYGELSASGAPRLLNRLTFADGGNITTIQSKVLVKKIQAIGCAGNSDPTDVEARIGGFFFNTGPMTPGEATNDVIATIALRRLSSSTSQSNVLEVIGSAFHCSNANCTTGSTVGSDQTLGTVLLGQKVKLRITWDPDGDQFIFQKGKDPEKSLSYSGLSDTSIPGTENGGLKRLEVFELVANCTSQPRPVGYVEVYFDDVYVNTIP